MAVYEESTGLNAMSGCSTMPPSDTGYTLGSAVLTSANRDPYLEMTYGTEGLTNQPETMGRRCAPRKPLRTLAAHFLDTPP